MHTALAVCMIPTLLHGLVCLFLALVILPLPVLLAALRLALVEQLSQTDGVTDGHHVSLERN